MKETLIILSIICNVVAIIFALKTIFKLRAIDKMIDDLRLHPQDQQTKHLRLVRLERMKLWAL